MKICYIADASLIHTQRWVEWFIKNGDDVHIISENDAAITGATIHRTEKLRNMRSFISLTFLIRKKVRQIDPELLHSHYVFNNGFFAAFSRVHPHITTAWGSDILVDAQRFFRRQIVKHTLKSADIITCDGENVKHEMIRFGINADKIHIIYHGVDTSQFNPIHRLDATHETLFGLDSGPCVISTRAFEPVYNVQSLIEAIPFVVSKVDKVKFIIAGTGSEEQTIKDRAQSLGVTSFIDFPGRIPHNDLPKYLANADIYVSTSLSDGGLAVSTAEAMASGLAVIVTNTGDNERWIIDGETGYIIPISDSAILAERLITMLTNEGQRQKMGQNCVLMIQDRYDFGRNMEQVQKIYFNLVGGQKCQRKS